MRGRCRNTDHDIRVMADEAFGDRFHVRLIALRILEIDGGIFTIDIAGRRQLIQDAFRNLIQGWMRRQLQDADIDLFLFAFICSR